MDDSINLGELIKEARAAKGYSQAKLSKMLVDAGAPRNVYSTYIGQIEKGEKVPSANVCRGLAIALDLDAELVFAHAYASRAKTPEEKQLARRLFSLLAQGTPPSEESRSPVATEPGRDLPDRVRETVAGLVRAAVESDDSQWIAVQSLVNCIVENPPPSTRGSDLLQLLACAQSLDEESWNMLCNFAMALTDVKPTR